MAEFKLRISEAMNAVMAERLEASFVQEPLIDRLDRIEAILSAEKK